MAENVNGQMNERQINNGNIQIIIYYSDFDKFTYGFIEAGKSRSFSTL